MDTIATVKINVGGKIFEAYRSLINRYPDTLLAKAVDIEKDEDEYCIDTEKAIFFDRDSERFGYILDYMRNGKIALPCFSICKDALMEDFVYFGFKQIDPTTIKRDLPIPVFTDQLKCFDSLYSTKIGEYTKAEADAIKAQAVAIKVAKKHKQKQ